MIEVDKRLMLFVSQDVNNMSGLIKAIENLSESVSRFRFIITLLEEGNRIFVRNKHCLAPILKVD